MSTTIFIIVSSFIIGYIIISVLLNYSSKVYSSYQFNSSNYEEPKTQENVSNKEIKFWYEVLEVEEFSSLEDIKKAYKSKIKQYHPDKVSSLGNEFQILAEQKTKEINSAYTKALSLHV